MSRNLFKIYDNRNYFWQWDKNQKLIVLDDTVDEVHFSNQSMNCAIVKDVCTDKDGRRVCDIPDAVFTVPNNLIASAYIIDDNAMKTLRSVKFAVVPRPLPNDYVQSDDFQYGDFVNRLNIIEDIIEDACLVQKFNTIEEAEKWAKTDKNIGAIISVNTGEKWKSHIVEDDYSLVPVCDYDELVEEINRAKHEEAAIANAVDQANDRITSAEDYIFDSVRTVISELDSLRFSVQDFIDKNVVDGLYYKNNMLYLTANGVIVSKPIEIVGGSGGGSGSGSGGSNNDAKFKVTNNTGWLYSTIAYGNECILKLNWSSTEDDMSTGKGTLQVYAGGVLKKTQSVDQGDIEVPISSLLTSGTNTIRLNISDVYGNNRDLNFTIEVISLSIASTFDGKPAYSGAINYYYVPTGAVKKTVYFLLDGKEIGKSVVTVSGQQQDFTIPAQNHGSHTFEVYLTAEIEGSTVESNHLYYDLICYKNGVTTPIIASTFNLSDVEQYDTFTIPYRVYNPAMLTSTISLGEDGVSLKELTVDRTEQQWSHRINDVGENKLTITCGDTIKVFNVNVTPSTVTVTAVSNNLVLDLSSHGRSNLEPNPLTWESNGISCRFSGFNLTSDGWCLDEDGVTVMRVGGDAKLTIPLKLFEADARTTGKTIELEFATRDVRNYEAMLISCMDGGRGLEITSQEAFAASAQTSLGTQYKEEEHIRLSFVIEKRTGTKMMLCYINGICSGTVAYPDDDDFMQNNAVEVSIGNSECTIDLYHIRVYDNDLTRHQVLNNWIADTQLGAQKKDRWQRNDVYDAYGNIVIEKLPKDLPYLVLEASVLPQFKGDKKSTNGYYVDPIHPERSFRFNNAQIDVQGTSSQYYKVKNYKIKFKNGFIKPDETISYVYELNENAVPVAEFTFKADVASSEGANNVVLAKLFDDHCPVKTPAQQVDSRIRQTIDGHPCVVFWDSGSGPVFVGKYNFNNDKGTHETFGFKSGDQSWEILQNGTDRVGFKNADFSGSDWEQDFEARYPDDNKDTTRLAEFITWVASTNTETATDEALVNSITYDEVEYTHDTEEYRLAKFKNEVSQWANVEHSIYYYLFTLLFLCIDQREKNAFPTYIEAMQRWIWLFYDADSTLGINNKGALAFSPFLEDIDYTEAGDPVFNGQANVFWTNLRLTFASEIEAMYQGWRTNGMFSYDIVKQLFDDHQAKWPEAIFNEDMYKKCIAAWVEDGDASYLPMLLGKKELQRMWWLFFRFRYMDSKFVIGTSMENRIMMRAHSRADIKLKAYAPIYGNVFYNALRVQRRMLDTSTEYLFPWDASGAEDAVIGINDADLITSLGDLSPLMVETIDLSKATHLTHLYLGSNAEGYENKNLLSLTLGNNTLLKMIDVRNCPNLTQSVDISGCTNVEEVYFDNTSITGLSLPNGGVLKTLHLPETVVNLTIKNHTALQEFVMPSYQNISTLWIENNSSAIKPLEILAQIPTNSRVRLIGLKLSVNSYQEIADMVARLDSMRGIDENNLNVATAQVSGTIYIDQINPTEYKNIIEIQSRYPSLVVIYKTLVPYKVSFCNYDGTVLQVVDVDTYGGSAEYTGETPVRPNTNEFEDWEFIDWNPEPTNVVYDVECIAQFKNNASMARALVMRGISGEYANGRVTSVGDYAFCGADKLTSVSLPYVTVIGAFAFQGCTNLVDIHLPSLTTISGYYAFEHCTNLRKIDIHEAVTNIPNAAFMTCYELEAVIIRNKTSVCALQHGSAFSNSCISREREAGYIYVPRALVDSYKTATNWSEYADKIRAIEDYPEICGGDV